jgi:Uma2 family endonuclease
MRMSPKSAFTYRDYEALPDDHRRYEIHDGELCVTPAPSFEHQLIHINLLRVLLQHVPAVAPGLLLSSPLDVILADRPDETTIVQPDILYIAPDRMSLTSRRGIEGGPTLAIEILSPSTRTIDRGTKRRLYARYGVPFLWLIDPDARVVEAFALESDRYVLAATAAGAEPADLPPFSGLALVPDALWAVDVGGNKTFPPTPP